MIAGYAFARKQRSSSIDGDDSHAYSASPSRSEPGTSGPPDWVRRVTPQENRSVPTHDAMGTRERREGRPWPGKGALLWIGSSDRLQQCPSVKYHASKSKLRTNYMSDEWDAIGFVISSQYRVAVLRRLSDGPATPSRIADDADFAIPHISRALNDLRQRALVELLVPEDRKKGRVYGITEKGNELWSQMNTQNLV